MKKIIGILGSLVAVYGSGALAQSFLTNMETPLTWWAGVLVCIIGGVSMLGYSTNFFGMGKIISLFNSAKESVMAEKTVDTRTPTTKSLVLSDDSLSDFECATHLVNRFIKASDLEGANLMRQVLDHIFDVQHSEIKKLADAKNPVS